MAETYTATDELSAVNTMLSTIGESPISTLAVSGSVYAEIAKAVLHEANRKVQAKGWHFNSEPDFPITPTIDGDLVVPDNVLKIDTTSEYFDYDLVQRGLRMYNRKEHTYTFNETIKFDVVFFLPFTEIPEAARQYIMIKAARIFQDRTVGSDVLHAFSQGDEDEALVLLQDADGDSSDHNILTDSQDVSSIWRRK